MLTTFLRLSGVDLAGLVLAETNELRVLRCSKWRR